MITQDSIEALKARLDIVDVVGSYLELKRAGVNFKAPCPFHDEKSPSFIVNPALQKYHCFGCGAHGDSIKFTMEYEKLNYPEAIEKLASSINFTLHYTDNSERKERSQLLETLNNWYQKRLTDHKVALRYLHDRGVFSSSIEKFGIGYAPTSAETLRFLENNRFAPEESIAQGALGRGEEGKLFARFIERITFPIHAPNGAIVGFGGRTITGHQAKYVNSSQSAIFNKSRLLYAYPLAREAIFHRKEIIITEGYLDVVMLHQAGFTHTVATLGTALTPEHLPLLRKGEPKVFVAYDGDKAGRAAALKASKLLSSSGFDGGVILFEGGLDPADMVREGKLPQLNALFHRPIAFIEFVLTEIIATYPLSDPRAKEAALHECMGYLKTLSPLMQEEYVPFTASQLGVSPALLKLTQASSSHVPTLQLTHYDVWELSLIKTLLDRPMLISPLLEFIDPMFLHSHSSEFIAVINGEDDPRLHALMMDERIRVFAGDEEVKAELITFLIKYYTKELQKVRSHLDSLDEKTYRIRQLRDKIARLKKGELVPLG
jgi:DNA primase